MKKNMAALILLFLVSGCEFAMSTADIPAVNDFDVKKYMGEWYEIARLPTSFERNLNQVRAKYALELDGTVSVLNSGIRDGKVKSIRGVARFKGSPKVGWLEVSFFMGVWGEYKIIRLDPEYNVAVVTGSDYDYLWILSRTPQLTPRVLLDHVDYARRLGFAVDELIFPLPAVVPEDSGG